MKAFIAVVRYEDTKLHKYLDFDLEVDAIAHVNRTGGFVAAAPSDYDTKYWVIDGVAETIVFDKPTQDSDTVLHNWNSLRTERDALLDSSDWTQSADSPLTDEIKTEWATYRQELRDLPANTPDPSNPTWPDAPS